MRAPRPLARPAVLALTLALGLALSACADDDSEVEEAVEDADRVVVADEDEDQAYTVDEADGTVVVEGSDEAEAALEEAVAASASGAARTAFRSSLGGASADDAVDGEGFATEAGDLQAVVDVRGRLADAYGVLEAEVEVRVVDGVTYLRFPQLLATADVDAEWLESDSGDDELDVGGLVGRARLVSPVEALAVLDEPIAVAEVGEERIDGTSTTHYVASVRLGSVLDATGAAADALGEAAVDRARAVEVHAHVDADGLVRRVEAELEDDGATVRLVVDLLERDVDDTVEVPPTDATITVREFLALRNS